MPRSRILGDAYFVIFRDLYNHLIPNNYHYHSSFSMPAKPTDYTVRNAFYQYPAVVVDKVRGYGAE